jgi:hypothetical protein
MKTRTQVWSNHESREWYLNARLWVAGVGCLPSKGWFIIFVLRYMFRYQYRAAIYQ